MKKSLQIKKVEGKIKPKFGPKGQRVDLNKFGDSSMINDQMSFEVD